MNNGNFWIVLFLVGAAWVGWKLLSARRYSRAVKETHLQTAPTSATQEDKQVRHMRNALSFVKTQHRHLSTESRLREEWEKNHGLAQVVDLDKLSGIEFEGYLGGIFKKQGYVVELTPVVADYGADLLLTQGNRKIAVQAKRYASTVGISAVQEAISGRAYYSCTEAWVVTTGTFTPNATALAEKSQVKLIDRSDLAKLIHRVNRASNQGSSEYG
jgi:HJR/Mrr/RecB family endonuclease